MPVVFRYKNFRFFFYSNEGDPLERAHIHVRSADGEAKFWLTPDVMLADNEGFNLRVVKELTVIVKLNKTSFLEAWNGYFS
jgi:hypothetical protein